MALTSAAPETAGGEEEGATSWGSAARRRPAAAFGQGAPVHHGQKCSSRAEAAAGEDPGEAQPHPAAAVGSGGQLEVQRRCGQRGGAGPRGCNDECNEQKKSHDESRNPWKASEALVLGCHTTPPSAPYIITSELAVASGRR
ncbi:hypothetical protein TRIUR3_28443 [Triticum urartu]|uniref:Uncharacterized protein n=1 Tax=Triticum urartu TaxID=4572 RepID=M7ZDI8_TRIUA|nr:hypothetical protein TRIUR3_28443 [Triticum urartu]